MHFKRFFSRPSILRQACILLASMAAGCTIQIGPGPGPGPGPEPTITEVDVERYELTGEYDWDRGRLVATVDITLAPLSKDTQAIVLDSAVTAVRAVRLAGGGALPFSTDEEKEQLRVDLSEVPALGSGKGITLEVDYEAAPSDALIPSPAGRKGDPLNVRALFTMSEPIGARRWMPSHDTPSDRAVFSVSMRMPDAEKMIANGDLVTDAPEGDGSHRMKYETAYTLPTYLMAFAISDFEVESTMKGDLPVSIWHRRGLQGHYGAVLGEMVGMLDHFEGLLGPYPFEKCAVVHLPNLPATGIENAGVSFHYEGAGTEPIAAEMSLTAHELAHQWFGDLVTLESWDDLWVKEGMATLLETEGLRAHTDKDGPFTLNGSEFGAMEGEAIHDTSLSLAEKYTSGPYTRAAWLMTQIRSVVGEEAFWQTLRGVLDKHRFGTIGTDAFIGAFAEVLGPADMAKVKHAVEAKGIPALTIAPLATGGATVTLNDPDGALIAPFDIGWVAEDGSMRTETLPIGQPLDVAPQKSGEILVMDPSDRHPVWDSFLVDDESMNAYYTDLLPLIVPQSPAAESRFLEIGAAAQDEVLWTSALPGATPEGFGAFMTALDSEWTQGLAMSNACVLAGDPGLDPQTAAAWASAMNEALLVTPPPFSLEVVQLHGYDACSMFDPVTAFADDWAKLQTGLASGEVDYLRLAYLTGFKIPAPLAMSTWGSVAKQSVMARARWLAAMELRTYLNELDPADVPAWRTYFIEMLSTTEDTDVLDQAIRAVVKLQAPTAAENADALAGLDVLLHSRWAQRAHQRAVCAAFTLTAGDAAAWEAFAGGLKDAPLSEQAAARLEDPSLCP
ncbi:M1 family metallopeptidase [Polyangium aurulentum]|uniref:M1 family metallopeptidase n=1 Tax=Polyangium aurulentum TaxID=2567896 RepID=UPI0010AE9E3A|nr:M1 family aminopeptidase [Polyangium aurulentum]UQA56363.1 aminopeptidase [Polyangium aurulentum]